MEEEHREQDDFKPVTDISIIKFLTISFVIAMYAVIFLKILFIK
jgi:hypothetical protein